MGEPIAIPAKEITSIIAAKQLREFYFPQQHLQLNRTDSTQNSLLKKPSTATPSSARYIYTCIQLNRALKFYLGLCNLTRVIEVVLRRYYNREAKEILQAYLTKQIEEAFDSIYKKSYKLL